MKISGYVAAAVLVAGAALMPSTASADVFTLGNCAVGADCGKFNGFVTITITENANDSKLVDFSVVNESNGAIKDLFFAYQGAPTGNGQVTNFVATPALSAGAPSASFSAGSNAGYSYNVDIEFPTSAGSRFNAGEAVRFTLGAPTTFNLNANDFSPIVAHVISLNNGADQSVWITPGGSTDPQTVPEPASIALFGFAALAAGNRMRRRAVK
jgi:PEP-CTERM motif